LQNIEEATLNGLYAHRNNCLELVVVNIANPLGDEATGKRKMTPRRKQLATKIKKTPTKKHSSKEVSSKEDCRNQGEEEMRQSLN
jgi:hypothetical protein